VALFAELGYYFVEDFSDPCPGIHGDAGGDVGFDVGPVFVVNPDVATRLWTDAFSHLRGPETWGESDELGTTLTPLSMALIAVIIACWVTWRVFHHRRRMEMAAEPTAARSLPKLAWSVLEISP
jgi:hypothetical protein